MKRAIAGVLVISLGLLLKSCDTTEPPPPPPDGDNIENTITLTTLWQDLNKIAINFTRSQLDTTGTFTYKLKRKNPTGNETQFLFMMLGMDTTFIDENLVKGTYYSYKVEAKDQQSETKDTSRTLLVTTLDTTSHEITWQIDTLGQPGDFLYDVWGLDENNVYAVGYVELQSGNSSIIKWDGIEWKPFTNVGGVKYGIFGFSDESIFVVGESSNRGIVAIWNNTQWTEYRSDYFLARGDTVYPLRSVWGSSQEDVWAVGDQGTIIHWDGSEWNKAEGINERYILWDIWGFDDECVYAAGNEWNQEAVLYYYNGIQWIKERTFNSIGIRLSSIWGPYKGILYFTDFQLYKIEGGMYDIFTLPNRIAVINKIRGYNTTSIFTIGDYGEIFHFNGDNWQKINLFQFPDPVILSGVKVFNSNIFIVGTSGDNKALILSSHIQ